MVVVVREEHILDQRNPNAELNMTPEEDAVRRFDSGFNCAESVLLTVSELELHQRMAGIIPRIATGFGGGIARNGDVCGALSGGVMAIGLVLGRDSPEASRDPCNVAVDRLYNSFMAKFGSCKCRELVGIDLKLAGKAQRQEMHHNCRRIVAWVAKETSQAVAKPAT